MRADIRSIDAHDYQWDDPQALLSGVAAARLVGISYRQLDYWVRTGLIDPARHARGSGTRRGFDAHDIALLRLAALLMTYRHDTRWTSAVLTRIAPLEIGDWRHHWLVVHPDGTVEIDGTVRDVAIVVQLAACAPLAAA